MSYNKYDISQDTKIKHHLYATCLSASSKLLAGFLPSQAFQSMSVYHPGCSNHKCPGLLSFRRLLRQLASLWFAVAPAMLDTPGIMKSECTRLKFFIHRILLAWYRVVGQTIAEMSSFAPCLLLCISASKNGSLNQSANKVLHHFPESSSSIHPSKCQLHS